MIAGMTYYQILWYFMIYSFLGWVTEVVFHAVKCGKIINRGFLNGPLCPVYGFGVLAVLALTESLDHAGTAQLNFWQLFLVGIVFATLVELIAGWLLDKLFHARWWDYSNKKFNFHGYICPQFSVIWGLAIVGVVDILQPFMEKNAASRGIPERIGWPVLAVLYAVFFADLIVTVMIVNDMNKRLKDLDQIQSSMRIVSDGLSNAIGSSAIKTSQRIGEREVQASLAKAELRDAAEQKRAEIQQKLLKNRVFGSRRLIRAFPDLKPHEHLESFKELKRRLEEK